MSLMRTDCDSPRMRMATASGRVVGERSTSRPADLRREPRSYVTLPIVSPRQRMIHPRVLDYLKPHNHKTKCGHGVVCEDRRDCRTARCLTCAAFGQCPTCRCVTGCRCPRTRSKIADLGGRAEPLTVLPFGGKVKPLRTNGKKRNGRKARLRASA